jgi:hypothetical protein
MATGMKVPNAPASLREQLQTERMGVVGTEMFVEHQFKVVFPSWPDQAEAA